VVTVPENVDAIHGLILEEHGISARKMAETLKISQEYVKFIGHDELDMRKLAVKWVPKCLNANQKCDHVLASQAILEHFRYNKAGFLPQLARMDETWIHLYDPETRTI
jgi:hypothetical protein